MNQPGGYFLLEALPQEVLFTGIAQDFQGSSDPESPALGDAPGRSDLLLQGEVLSSWPSGIGVDAFQCPRETVGSSTARPFPSLVP